MNKIALLKISMDADTPLYKNVTRTAAEDYKTHYRTMPALSPEMEELVSSAARAADEVHQFGHGALAYLNPSDFIQSGKDSFYRVPLPDGRFALASIVRTGKKDIFGRPIRSTNTFISDTDMPDVNILRFLDELDKENYGIPAERHRAPEELMDAIFAEQKVIMDKHQADLASALAKRKLNKRLRLAGSLGALGLGSAGLMYYLNKDNNNE